MTYLELRPSEKTFPDLITKWVNPRGSISDMLPIDITRFNNTFFGAN